MSKPNERFAIELRRLFGDVTPVLAEIVDAANLTLTTDLMDAVHDGADVLLALREQPDAQLRYVARLPSDVRLALCMWLLDTELAAKLTARAMNE